MSEYRFFPPIDTFDMVRAQAHTLFMVAIISSMRLNQKYHDETTMSQNADQTDHRIPVFLLKTKSAPRDGYEEYFSTAHNALFEPLFVPVLEHKFLEKGLNIVRGLLKNDEVGKGDSKKYGGLIFTSQRAVEAFAKLVEEGSGTYIATMLSRARS